MSAGKSEDGSDHGTEDGFAHRRAAPSNSKRRRRDVTSDGPQSESFGTGVEDNLRRLPGVGPATAARLAEHGLTTVADILGFFPRRYDDLRTMTPLATVATCEEGTQVLVSGTVTRINVFPGRFLMVQITEGTDSLVARWFRVPGGMARAFEKGARVVLAGPLRLDSNGKPELIHPSHVTAAMLAAQGAGEVGLGIRPRYPVVAGVGARVIERIVGAAVDRFSARAPEALPEATRQRLELPSIDAALHFLHTPSAVESSAAPQSLRGLFAGDSPAHRRMAIEDLLVVQVGLAARRGHAQRQPGRPCAVSANDVLTRVQAALPFVLTAAQSRAIAAVQADLARPIPMQRLLVGDVGSGKTAVAFAAAAHVALSGGQTLLMAPTEVLAEQHARTLGALGDALGFRVALLTATTPRPQRESILALARAGRISMLVGTQALLADRVALSDLRLAIVDEQHRFGVAQRAQLRKRDDADTGTLPHLLVMTATPIPRTLAFTLYGDLDLTVVDELPPGRRPVRTRLLRGRQGRQESESILATAVSAGRRAFVVCPVREISARAGAVTAVSRHAELTKRLPTARVGLVHGELDAREKDAALRAFAGGQLDVLVATTVIEVGIDVPEASLMIVEDAERFGLAQLHQLRGRVGRGAEESECLLVAGNVEIAVSEDAWERLRVLVDSNDGFKIAEADLQNRGFGDLFGERQSGLPRLRFSDFAAMGRLLEVARSEAELILRDDPDLSFPENAGLKTAVQMRWASSSVFGQEAG